jgi:hypothetical protein
MSPNHLHSFRAARVAGLALLITGLLLADAKQAAAPPKDQLNPGGNERLAALDARLTGYQPSCTDLRQLGVPRVRRVGDDLMIVVPNPTENEFHVFAIGYATGRAQGTPEITWQGGQLSDAIGQACSRDGAR